MKVLFDTDHDTGVLMAHDDDLGSLPIPFLIKTVRIVTDALRAEGVDSDTVDRVRNRVIWGNPQGDPEHNIVLIDVTGAPV